MFHYFNVKMPTGVGSNVPERSCFAFIRGPIRKFVSHSTRVRNAVLEDRDVEVGQLVTPTFDSDETIRMGIPNLFTDPNMSYLDRFEAALSIGKDAIDALHEAIPDHDIGASGTPVESAESENAQ